MANHLLGLKKKIGKSFGIEGPTRRVYVKLVINNKPTLLNVEMFYIEIEMWNEMVLDLLWKVGGASKSLYLNISIKSKLMYSTKYRHKMLTFYMLWLLEIIRWTYEFENFKTN